jgi:hypothetical protein
LKDYNDIVNKISKLRDENDQLQDKLEEKGDNNVNGNYNKLLEENNNLKQQIANLNAGKSGEQNQNIKDLENKYKDENNKLKLEINELQKKLNESKPTIVTSAIKKDEPQQQPKQVDNKGNKEDPNSFKEKKVQIFETKQEDSKKKEDKKEEGRTGEVFKSMKVSGIAKQLEAILNKPKPMGGEPQKEETPIVHTKVDLAEENKETPAVSYGGGSRRKRAKKNFVDNE